MKSGFAVAHSIRKARFRAITIESPKIRNLGGSIYAKAAIKIAVSNKIPLIRKGSNANSTNTIKQPLKNFMLQS